MGGCEREVYDCAFEACFGEVVRGGTVFGRERSRSGAGYLRVWSWFGELHHEDVVRRERDVGVQMRDLSRFMRLFDGYSR